MLKLNLEYFGLLMRRTDSLEKTLMVGKTEGRRRKGGQDEMVGWHRRLNGHAFEHALGVGDGQGSLECHSPWVLSCFSRVQLFVTPQTVTCQTPFFHGILQARILEWIAMPSSRGSSLPSDRTSVSYICIG